jgi:hypothetical protein
MLRLVLEFVLFIISTGIFFGPVFRKNRLAVFLAGLVASVSFGFLAETIWQRFQAPTAVVATGSAPPVPQPSADELFWLAIKDSDVLAFFEEFLHKFPTSGYAGSAKKRIEEIKRKLASAASGNTPQNVESNHLSPTLRDKQNNEGISQRIAIGEWVLGSWVTSESEAYENIMIRNGSPEHFRLFQNVSRLEIRPEGAGKALYQNGRRISEVFDDISDIRKGTRLGTETVAVNVKRGTQWTVAVNGKPWNAWFDQLYGYAVISKGVAIGVKVGNRWTIAVDGVPWRQQYDSIRGFNIFADGSVIAEVISNGGNVVVKDGIEDFRLPVPRYVRMNERGKIAWYSQLPDRATVTVGFTSTWKSTFPKIQGLVVAFQTGQVVAQATMNGKSTAIVDDVPWQHWYESDAPGIGVCNTSPYLRVNRNGHWTLVVNDKAWANWFDELGATGCEKSGAISIAAKKNDKWAIVRGGQVITDWFSDLRGWAINQDGTYLAAAVAEKQPDQTLSWKVIVLPLTPSSMRP